jgi:hypothetical protein
LHFWHLNFHNSTFDPLTFANLRFWPLNQINAHMASDSYDTSPCLATWTMTHATTVCGKPCWCVARESLSMWQNMLTWYVSHWPHVRWLDQNQWEAIFCKRAKVKGQSCKFVKVKGSKVLLWKLSDQNFKFVKIRGVKMQFSQRKIERNNNKL